MQWKTLAVDLDGTLIRSDMLIETGFAYLKANPLRFYRPLVWIAKGGKAHLKAKLAAATHVDVATLPYDPKVIEWLKRERAAGRSLVLATASDASYAEAISGHLGLFDRTLATDGKVNLSSGRKRDALVREFGNKGFDYAGNSHDDIAVWEAAERAYVVNPSPGVARRAQKIGNVESVLQTRKNPVRVWLKALRVHQWLKNLLIFIPLLASHQVSSLELDLRGVLAFVLFGFCASSVYLLNDLLDLDDDRHHPTKRRRPFASGSLSIIWGMVAFPVLAIGAFAGALILLPWRFAAVLAGYYVLTMLYSFVLKRRVILDVVVLAMLYTARIIAGTAAFRMTLTFWLLGFSMFLFLSLALVKRYAELHATRAAGGAKARGRGYVADDLSMISSLGAASGYLSVLVLALYIQDSKTTHLYSHPQVIWLACPLLLYWISRTWLITHRGLMHDDPVVFAAKDRTSLLTVALMGLVFWFAT
ncbi:UbiA family prenyltransferase [Paraburkholderia fungorum]|uniref:4-hydroxybenzoate polyprenyltransferase n=1 Tax=Paraburkholderia fungorum TaxID=134537 RepID=A0AAW3V495_9BURK|nr:UbiA family prenyltransferase [Paraburkholderia fungorum]MBB4517805.1 4-hydroxybenzoate polyprenyltransferase [Paraburkholderia fungorum]MBB6205774.1 4-hydroxybenzoate polyprenyltransferase [Paraburkholderia fungorum]